MWNVLCGESGNCQLFGPLDQTINSCLENTGILVITYFHVDFQIIGKLFGRNARVFQTVAQICGEYIEKYWRKYSALRNPANDLEYIRKSSVDTNLKCPASEETFQPVINFLMKS